MPIATAVLVVTVCTASNCPTYKIAEYYGSFQSIGKNHCEGSANAMNSVPSPKGTTMHYQCHGPDNAKLVITADVDRKF